MVRSQITTYKKMSPARWAEWWDDRRKMVTDDGWEDLPVQNSPKGRNSAEEEFQQEAQEDDGPPDVVDGKAQDAEKMGQEEPFNVDDLAVQNESKCPKSAEEELLNDVQVEDGAPDVDKKAQLAEKMGQEETFNVDESGKSMVVAADTARKGKSSIPPKPSSENQRPKRVGKQPKWRSDFVEHKYLKAIGRNARKHF